MFVNGADPFGVTGAVPWRAVGTGVSSAGIPSWPQIWPSLSAIKDTPLPARSSRKGHQYPVPEVCPAAPWQLSGTAKVLSSVEKFSDF